MRRRGPSPARRAGWRAASLRPLESGVPGSDGCAEEGTCGQEPADLGDCVGEWTTHRAPPGEWRVPTPPTSPLRAVAPRGRDNAKAPPKNLWLSTGLGLAFGVASSATDS